MADIVHLGVVGCGGIAKNVLVPSALKIPGFRLRAFADATIERAQQMCSTCEGEYATTDVNRLLTDKSLDAVLICTLPDTHAALAIDFLNAGKHVFLQKPAAVTYEQCRALVRAAASARSKSMVAYCYRLSPLVNRVREVLGAPKVIYARMMVKDVAQTHAHYLANPAMGQPMLELACHNLDMAYWLAASVPLRVSAFGGNLRHPGKDVVDNLVINIEFQNGSVASVVSVDAGADDFARKWFAEFYGNETTATIDGFRTLRIYGKHQEELQVEYNTGIGIDRDMAVFHDTIIGKGASSIPISEGIVASVLMLKAFDSLRSGKTENVNLKDFSA